MNRAIVINIFILSLLFPSTGICQQSDIEDQVKMIDAHLAAGDFTKALVVIEDILVVQPTNLDVQEKKIEILSSRDRSKEASKDIEEYIQMYPSQPEYFYLRAILSMQREKYNKAINDFNAAYQLDMPPKLANRVYLNRGMAYFNIGDFELAEADFDQVISTDSRNAAAYHGKGMVKYELAMYEEAVSEFQKSLKIDEENAISHYNMAMSYFRLHENENACYHFNKACSLGLRNACRLLMMECDINIDTQ